MTMPTKDKIEIVAWIAIAVAAYISLVTLILNIQTLNQQREAQQISIFNGLVERMDNLADNLATMTMDRDTLAKFDMRMLSTLNQFAFYANRGFLSQDMVNSRTLYMIERSEHMAEEWPEVVEALRAAVSAKEEEAVLFPDLGLFYERTTGKKFPLWKSTGVDISEVEDNG